MKKIVILTLLFMLMFMFGCKTEVVYVKSKQTKMKEQGIDPNKQEKKDPEITDIGVHRLPNGDKYIGGFKDRKKFGEGEYIYKNGDKYKGFCEEGVFNGYGELTLKNGVVYKGQFKDGLKEGDGTLFFPSGSRYEGLRWCQYGR